MQIDSHPEMTATERRLLEHARSANAHGIGTKCATGEDIDVAKAMVAKGWMIERPNGRFITDVGRCALAGHSGSSPRESQIG